MSGLGVPRGEDERQDSELAALRWEKARLERALEAVEQRMVQLEEADAEGEADEP